MTYTNQTTLLLYCYSQRLQQTNPPKHMENILYKLHSHREEAIVLSTKTALVFSLLLACVAYGERFKATQDCRTAANR